MFNCLTWESIHFISPQFKFEQLLDNLETQPVICSSFIYYIRDCITGDIFIGRTYKTSEFSSNNIWKKIKKLIFFKDDTRQCYCIFNSQLIHEMIADEDEQYLLRLQKTKGFEIFTTSPIYKALSSFNFDNSLKVKLDQKNIFALPNQNPINKEYIFYSKNFLKILKHIEIEFPPRYTIFSRETITTLSLLEELVQTNPIETISLKYACTLSLLC